MSKTLIFQISGVKSQEAVSNKKGSAFQRCLFGAIAFK
jgi:hypothetical protein